jgi:hypothetical protein
MKNLFCIIFLFSICTKLNAQKRHLDFVKSGVIDTTKEIGVRKERKDKFGYNSQIETTLLKAGYNVADESKSFYIIEYYVGPQPVKGRDDFAFRIKTIESSTGKLVAMASVISSRRSDLLNDLQNYIDEFVRKMSK